jgi:hypothetical protein
MGRVKELFMQMYYANNESIPQEATIADLQRMEDLKIYEWKAYERAAKLKEERIEIDEKAFKIQQDQIERQIQQKEIIKQYSKNKQ